MHKTTKQTAANNKLLKYVKKTYNAKAYSTALGLVNSVSEAAAIEYLARFIREESRPAYIADLTSIAGGL